MQDTATYELVHICDMTGAFQLAIHCNTPPINATLAAPYNTLQYTATHCSKLQHVATNYNTLQYTGTRCDTLQHVATHCKKLQHMDSFMYVTWFIHVQARSGWPSNLSSPFWFLLFCGISNKRDTAMLRILHVNESWHRIFSNSSSPF